MELLTKRSNVKAEIGPEPVPPKMHLVSEMETAPLATQLDGVSSEIRIVSANFALALLDAAYFDRQRKVTQSRVEYLSNEMKAGRFVPGTPIYLGRLPSGRMLLLNGQHTLWAITDAKGEITLTLITKEVADEDEAGRLYAVFDIHRVRSFRDSALGVEGEKMDKLRARAASAIYAIERRMDFKGSVIKSRIEVIDQMHKYEEALQLFRSVLAEGATTQTRSFATRVPILAVILLTFHEQPSLASEFWGRMIKDEGLTKGDPARALLSFLRNLGTSGGGGGEKAHQMACATALAWNAEWDGRKIDHVKPGSMISLYVKGTSYAKGRPPAPETEGGLEKRTSILLRDYVQRHSKEQE